MMAMGSNKLAKTSNYAMFSIDDENRPLQLNGAKRSELRRSMQKYGFLKAYPILCVQRSGKLWVKDGQHRLAIAQELGLAVWYVIEDQDIDIAALNNTQCTWKASDYLGRYAAQGNTDYIELQEFRDRHRLTISLCIGLLGDQAEERNLHEKFKSGKFKVKSRKTADRIATLYTRIGEHNRRVKSRFLMGALFAMCQIDGLDDERLLHGVERCPELLVSYGSREGYLDMLERLYNYGRRTKYPLKIEAENAIRRRNPANRQIGKDAAAA
jgi:hypothetical protein